MPLIPKKSARNVKPPELFRFTCNGKYSPKNLENFWPKIDTAHGLGPNGDCWEWRGQLDKDGYGIFRIMKNGKQYKYLAHRAAYEMATGKIIPNGKVIMHKCDNPLCVKQYSHLKLGTHLDNEIDKDYKKRRPCGETHYKSVLNNEEVSEIRYKYNYENYTAQQLSDKYGTSKANIESILDNSSWYDENYIKIKYRKGNSKLNQTIADEIRQLKLKTNLSNTKIGNIYGVNRVTIDYILKGKTWRIKNAIDTK